MLFHRPSLLEAEFNFFEDDFGGDALSGASPAFLSYHEFQHKYRMKRVSFQKLVSLIQDHPVFHPPPDAYQKGHKQSPPVHQLMVFLYYLGTEGSSASNPNQYNVYWIGHGTSELYKQCVMTVIINCMKELQMAIGRGQTADI